MTKFWWIMLVVVASGLVISAFFRILTPKESAPKTNFVQTNFDGGQTQFSNLIIRGEVNIVSQLPAYQASIRDAGSELINQLIDSFELDPHPSLNFIWTGSNYSLTHNQELDNYTLSHNYPLSVSGDTIGLETAEQEARLFIEEHLGSLSLKPITNQAKFYPNEMEKHEAVSPAEARIIDLALTHEFIDYPIHLNKSIVPTFLASFSRYGLIHLSFYPVAISLDGEITLPTLNLSQLESNINNNLAFVGRVNRMGLDPLDISTLTNGHLDFEEIQYHYDPETSLMVPYAYFSGQATEGGGQVIEIGVLTPAISVN